MKKLLILSDINSAHTQKWVCALADSGIEVGIFTLSYPVSDWYKSIPNVRVLFASKKLDNTFAKGSFSKIKYIKVVPELKKVILNFKPDILHAYYATSYGLIGALSKFHPYLISAWGSDVMDFPNKSYFHKKILQFNFKKTDMVLATSKAIESAIRAISEAKVEIIPFGINTEVFVPMNVERNFSKDSIVIGTIKSLEAIYGIDLLIHAFKRVCEKHANIEMKLFIVGGGTKEERLKNLVKELNLKSDTVFAGKLEFNKIVQYHNMIDIFVNVSRNESFGVSVLESSACEKPVIASNIGGLKEVVVNNKTGFLIESENIDAIADAMEKLILDKNLRKEMGINGRKFVKEKYEFSTNIKDTISLYHKLVN